MIVASFCAVGCGDPIGTPCQFQGSGFHASTNCRHQCLEVRPIDCPDGRRINPAVCSGPEQCGSGTCAEGQVCYHVSDPFNEESFCVAADLCGPLDADALSQWERRTHATALELRETYAERMRRRTGQTSSPSDRPAGDGATPP